MKTLVKVVVIVNLLFTSNNREWNRLWGRFECLISSKVTVRPRETPYCLSLAPRLDKLKLREKDKERTRKPGRKIQHPKKDYPGWVFIETKNTKCYVLELAYSLKWNKSSFHLISFISWWRPETSASIVKNKIILRNADLNATFPNVIKQNDDLFILMSTQNTEAIFRIQMSFEFCFLFFWHE